MLRKRLDTPELDPVIEELALALEELRELARGLHPAALSRGLYAAVGALATRSPVPVEYDVVEERLPDAIEVAVYYVIGEAITNAVKHAEASVIRVTAWSPTTSWRWTSPTTAVAEPRRAARGSWVCATASRRCAAGSRWSRHLEPARRSARNFRLRVRGAQREGERLAVAARPQRVRRA